VTKGGERTLVAVSLRRGDYRQMQSSSMPWFRIVPAEWYRDWLRTIRPTLRDPVLFVASDEPEHIVPMFQEFEQVRAAFGPVAGALPHHIRDFEVLRRADYLAICNSSFPRFAAILAPSTQKCYLPSFAAQSFAPYEAWMDPAFWVRFEDAWRGTVPPGTTELPADGLSAVNLPLGEYMPVGTAAEDGANSVCASGWFPAEPSGVRACQPTSTLRFRADAPEGARIHLVLRLAAYGRDFRIRIYANSSAETEVSLADGSQKVAALSATVEPGELVTAHLVTMGTPPGGEESTDGYWMLQGILYFDPKRAVAAGAAPQQ